jgi:alkanesulfonate monooxygenase SsuD/methylene tetrahydromethanopterin reductase-like flavin-dependent oxidoreductase (luciferase family)
MKIGFKTSPQDVDWPTLDATWQLAGELPIFEAGWLNDHITGLKSEGGPSLESLTLMAALAHRVPGKWLGHAVLSNTFRHPVMVAKAATLMDHVTGGRFILGLGAGWLDREHEPYGIALPPIGERIDRLSSALETIAALMSRDAAAPPGVSRTDPFYPLDGATNAPAPLTPGGPPIFLGGQKRRGIELAVRFAQGWVLPAGPGVYDVAYFARKHDEIRAALEAGGRDPDDFTFAGQVACGTSAADRREAREQAVAMHRAGANHVILGLVPSTGPDGLAAVAREVAEPLAEAWGA